MLPEPISVTLLVAKVLEALDVSYFIGGSLASTVYGMVRTTQDVDIIADLKPDHAQSFIRLLKEDFYIDDNMILDSIQKKTSFNIIHRTSMFKVDVFLLQNTSFEYSQVRRKQKLTIAQEPDSTVYFASPEDTIISKLRWYQMGGEVYERQWGDVIGILKVRKGNLDLEYLRKWAVELDVIDMFERALQSVNK